VCYVGFIPIENQVVRNLHH